MFKKCNSKILGIAGIAGINNVKCKGPDECAKKNCQNVHIKLGEKTYFKEGDEKIWL